MKIESGKSYRTRNGSMIVEVTENLKESYFRFSVANVHSANHVNLYWEENGRISSSAEADLDLVEEVEPLRKLQVGSSYFTRERIIVTIMEVNLLNTRYKGRYFCPLYKQFFEAWWYANGMIETRVTDDFDLIEEIQ
jgi:hypothetical protein